MSTTNICRLCLHRAPITFSILNSKSAEMLDALTSIKIDSTDPISAMCLKCNLNLKLAYTIQQKIIQNEEKLKSDFLNYQNEDSIKIEIAEEVIKEEPEFTVCVICDTTVDANSLPSHTKNHFNEQFCDLCNQSFNDIKTYRSHLLEHPNYSPYKCDECHATFLYKSLYDIHKNSAHIKKEILEELPKPQIDDTPKSITDPPFKCEICQREYPVRKKLLNHYSNCHRRKECPICKKFITASNYYKHVLNHNTNPKVCEKCGKVYTSSERLRGHYLYHHSGKLYKCEQCKAIFKSRQMLRYHQKRDHDVGYICETCGKKFLFSSHLKTHIQKIHLKLRPHICEICEKSFSSLRDIKRHRRAHTNETPYRCVECGESFKQNVSLRMHKKSKHNIVETVTCKCDTCGKGFASTHALKAHMRYH